MDATQENPTERLIEVTEGNLRNAHFYITPIEGWLPPDCVGDSMTRDGVGVRGVPVEMELVGLPAPVYTDIGYDPNRNGARRFFRARGPVSRFYRLHKVQPGDLLRVTRLGERRFRVEPTGLRGEGNEEQEAPRHLADRAMTLPAPGARDATRIPPPGLPQDLIDRVREAHEHKERERHMEWLVAQTLEHLGHPDPALRYCEGYIAMGRARSAPAAVVEVRRRIRLRAAAIAAFERGLKHAVAQSAPWVVATDAARYVICRTHHEQPILDRCLVGSFDLLDFSVSDVAALSLLRIGSKGSE